MAKKNKANAAPSTEESRGGIELNIRDHMRFLGHLQGQHHLERIAVIEPGRDQGRSDQGESHPVGRDVVGNPAQAGSKCSQ